MKYFLSILLLSITIAPVKSQGISESEDAIKILYASNYMKYEDSKKVSSDLSILYAKNNSSFFIWKNMIKLDSIRKARELNVADITFYRTYEEYALYFNNQNVSHFETIGNEIYSYDETLDFEWTLHDESLTVNGYKCKKASLTYGGRNWTAWYSPEIPFAYGPYKFRGLPGLILKMEEDTGVYSFEALSVQFEKTIPRLSLESQFIKASNPNSKTVPKSEFKELKRSFYSLSANDRVAYMNRDKDEVYGLQITGMDGVRMNTKRTPRVRNFIEN